MVDVDVGDNAVGDVDVGDIAVGDVDVGDNAVGYVDVGGYSDMLTSVVKIDVL